MANVAVLFAKLAGLHKTLLSLKEDTSYNPDLSYFDLYENFRQQLISALPEMYSELVHVQPPQVRSGTSSSYSLGYLYKPLLLQLEYIFEVRANSEIVHTVHSGQAADPPPRRVFISHGRGVDWHKVQAYIEKDVRIDTLELAQEANRGRTVLQKLNEEAAKCSYAVIVMTGDDELGDGERPRARENVMHEIGFFQGKYGLENVCLLYEEGTNIPSNIHGLVYIPFPKGYVNATFGALRRELDAAFSDRR